jgi:hypothetical protein
MQHTPLPNVEQMIQITPQGSSDRSQMGSIPHVQIEQNDIIVEGESEGDTSLRS